MRILPALSLLGFLSLGGAHATGQETQPISCIIDNFESGKLTWTARSQAARVPLEYSILEEGANHFLRGAPPLGAEGLIALVKHPINLEKSPMLSWRWRVIQHPKVQPPTSLSDTAVSVYVHFKHGLFGTRLLKYVWAAGQQPSQWHKPSKKIAFYDIRTKVLRSAGPVNAWMEESVNLVKDYQEAYETKKSVKEAQGVGVLTDGDQSQSVAIGDYDDFCVKPVSS